MINQPYKQRQLGIAGYFEIPGIPGTHASLEIPGLSIPRLSGLSRLLSLFMSPYKNDLEFVFEFGAKNSCTKWRLLIGCLFVFASYFDEEKNGHC